MKSDIHPQYYPEAKVTCACGNVFTVGSTKEKINVEICSACHPLYTGEEKILDTAGRVEKFKARSAVAKAMADKRAKAEQKSASAPKVKKVKK
ncbi:MAG: 50S ribosomal protein L31 [bacterium]|nr:50S ribosomal protein L31 [bacterium]